MAFITFYQNPRKYLLTHKMLFTPGGQLTAAQAAGVVPNGAGVWGGNVAAINNPTSMVMNPHAAYDTGIRGAMRSAAALTVAAAQKTVWYSPNPGVGIPGFAALPWNNDTVVYCDITAAAPAITMIVTGPLTGCHLTVFRVPPGPGPLAGHVFFMHTNANGAPGLPTTNAMRDHVMALLGAPPGTPHADCRFGIEYNGQAFAFVQVNAGIADCYVHSVPLAGLSTTQRWGHV